MKKIKNKINLNFTFKNFFIGNFNQFVTIASKLIINNPGKIFNPFYIYGETGLGKTHLINAIINYILKKKIIIKIKIITTIEFVVETVKIIKSNNYDNFNYFYNNLEFLLIDDLQFLKGKKKIQEEFLKILENFKKNNKQIIITSNTIPKKILGLDERIISRLEEGLILQIKSPSLKMRIKIILKKAYLMKINITYDIAFFIAQNFISNISELIGILKIIKFTLKIYKKKNISLDIIKVILSNRLINKKKEITIKNIKNIIVDFYKIKLSDLNSNKRYFNIIKPKQIAIYLSKKFTKKSLKEISIYFGYKNHSTIIYTIKKVKFLKKNNEKYNLELSNLIKIIKK